MKKIEKLIPSAIDSITECKVISEDGSVPKEFNGYISSFGASLISAGILPTVIFYSQKGDSNHRHKVIQCLEYTMKKHYSDVFSKETSLVKEIKRRIEENSSTTRLEEKLTDAAIALKLAIRTFPKSKTVK